MVREKTPIVLPEFTEFSLIDNSFITIDLRHNISVVVTITDPADERVADYRALTDLELRTRFEPPNGLFIAEGEKVVRRALRAGYRPRSLLVEQKRTSQVADLADAAVCYAGAEEVLESLTGFHVHRGILGSFHRGPSREASAVVAGSRRLAVLEGINNHTNIGAIFRCAAGLGMDGVLLNATCADPLYRRSVRVSMGEVFAIPYAFFPQWPRDLSLLRRRGFTIAALTPEGDAMAIQRLDSAPDDKIALMLGGEGPGLQAHSRELADIEVAIPMRGGVDSLNVAAAAAVAFWEINR